MNLKADGSLKRIAVCTAGELFGGVERHILGVMSGLQAHGIEALLVLFHDGELAAQARDQGIEAIILPGPNRFLWSTSQALAGILRQRLVRIVHVHGYKATVFCALARIGYPFALVKTEHGLPEPMAGRPLRVLRDRFYHFLDTRATRMAGASICYVTAELRLYHARAHAGLRTSVIPNGVANMDRGRFERPPELRRDWFNLVIVGRLETVKGHHVAIGALADASMPPDVNLQIVGTGPSEAPLRALAQKRGVSDRVHFLGFRRNVYEYLAHCDVLLMPSLHEGLPYTLLEGMALGTCIVASRVGGLMEAIEHGVSGLLLPAADPSALASAIRELHDDQELRKRHGEFARQMQRARYSLDAMALRYVEEYRAALKTFASPGAGS
jgi:glycosyltransferase involved in cell wall biosynthesis